MLYVITAEDAPDTLSLRINNRAAHLARLQQLKDQQRLILAGPHPRADAAEPDASGFSGSTIVAEFESLQAARDWAQADPYFMAGVYQSVAVKPFYRVF